MTIETVLRGRQGWPLLSQAQITISLPCWFTNKGDGGGENGGKDGAKDGGEDGFQLQKRL